MGCELCGNCPCVHHSEVTLSRPQEHWASPGKASSRRRRRKPMICTSDHEPVIPNTDHAPQSGGFWPFCFCPVRCLSPDCSLYTAGPWAEPSNRTLPHAFSASPPSMMLITFSCIRVTCPFQRKLYQQKHSSKSLSNTHYLPPFPLPHLNVQLPKISSYVPFENKLIFALLTLPWVLMITKAWFRKS